MPAPALKIPVSVDLAAFQDGMEKASSGVGETVKLIGRAFQQLNGDVVTGALGASAGVATGWAQSAVKIAGSIGTIIAATEIMIAIIGQAREELAHMVEIADKANERKLSPEFFQKFLLEAKNLKVTAGELEQALTSAFAATREKIDPNATVFDATLTKVSELSAAMRDYNLELFDASNKSKGLDLFQSSDVGERIRGVVTTMRDLQKIGQDVAALDLAEKLFGSALADRMRQGAITAEGILKSLDSVASLGTRIVPDTAVLNAKEIDDRLKKAHQTLDDQLKPSWEGLALVLLDLKLGWTEIVEFMGKAVGLAATIGKFLNKPLFSTPAANDAGNDIFAGAGVPKEALIPLPRARNTTNAPNEKPKKETAERDDFDQQVNAINRHIAALNADGAAVGLNAAAHATLRAELSLLQAAEREGSEVTVAQIDAYTTLRATMGAKEALDAAGITLNQAHAASFDLVTQRIGATTQRLEDVKRAFQGANDAALFFGNQGVEILGNLNKQTRAMDVLRSAVSSLTKEYLKAGLTGQGAFASLFGTASTTGGTGGLFGAFAKLFAGTGNTPNGTLALTPDNLAVGTDNWSGGPTWVGENGPEIVNLPRGAQVIPNNIAMRGAAAASPSIVYAPIIDARGADAAAVGRLAAAMADDKRNFERNVMGVVRGRLRNDRDALNR